MKKARRTLKGLRADHGNVRQADVAKAIGMAGPTYNIIEQFVDDPTTANALGKLFGVKLEVIIRDVE